MDRKQITYKVRTFLYSASAGFKFNIVGQLGANEILALLNSFSVKKWAALYRNIPDMKRINIAYLVLLLSQAISDVVNHSATMDLVRGWANIVMAIVVTNFLARLLWDTKNGIIAYLFGAIITMLFFGPDTEGISLENMGFFKFKLVPMLNAAMLIIAWYLLRQPVKGRFNIVMLFIAYALFNVAFDSRSNGVVFILIAIVLYKKQKMLNMTFKKIMPYLIIFCIIFQCLYSLYVSQVLAGKIGGAHAREQFAITKNPYNPINLLLAGRSEVYVALVAIGDKPIFGHGSWAPDPGAKYTQIGYRMQGEEEKFESLLEYSAGPVIIPSHSVIFGAWMTAGFLGFLAMLYIAILFFRRGILLLKNRIVQNSPFFPAVLFYSTSSIWTFLFSPLPHIKQTLPIAIAFIIVLYRKAQVEYDLDKERKNAVKLAGPSPQLSHPSASY